MECIFSVDNKECGSVTVYGFKLRGNPTGYSVVTTPGNDELAPRLDTKQAELLALAILYDLEKRK